MNIFDHFQHINLTNDQNKALEKLNTFLENDDRIFILQGYAGSGKTTLLKGFVKYLESINKKYQLMAPTGRAAKVINQKTGIEATTIHKGIYSFDDLQEIKDEDDNGVSFLYQYKFRNNPEVHNSVLIVDEASMVSDILSQGEFFRFGSGFLLRDLITYSRIQEANTSSKIIFIGDPAQLPPIGMNFSPALSPDYLLKTYKLQPSCTELKEVKRQGETNGILLSANKIRQCLTSGYFNDFDLRENKKDIFNPPFQSFLERYRSESDPKVIISYKNKTALELNKAIRRDKFGDDLPIQASDIVIVGGNNYKLGIMNGEFAVVGESSPYPESRDIRFNSKDGRKESVTLTWRSVDLVLPDENNQPRSVSGYILENYLYGDNFLKPEEQIALYVDFKKRNPSLDEGTEEFKEALRNDKYFNCIQVKYGYAVTCHKAQGGEWPNVFVFWDKGVLNNLNFYESEHNVSGKVNPEFYRWAYTAVTRASSKLFCINPPFFSSFSKMTFVDVNVQNAFNQLTGQTAGAVDLEFDNNLLKEVERLGLQDAPLTIQDHFIRCWYLLGKKYIYVAEWARVGYEIRYVFKRENQVTAFKFWINGKNEFRADFQKLPGKTNSNELYDEIAKILTTSIEIVVNRNNANGVLKKVEFDIQIEESKPFLKNLFNCISKNLEPNEIITDITHLQYKERYTIEKNGSVCVIDFEYNKDGFFGRALPVEKQCNNPDLLERIKGIVNNLKEADYVI